MEETQLKRTPLFEIHTALDARMVEFGGWEMPVLYSGISQEHLAVRQAAGLFDISHMGEFLFDGPDSLKFLNQLLTNNLAKLESGQGQYTLLCQDNGGVIDDLYAYRLGDTRYLLVVNASRLEIDWMWIKAQRNSRHKSLQLEMTNLSGETSRQWRCRGQTRPGSSPAFFPLSRRIAEKPNHRTRVRRRNSLGVTHRLHRRGWLRAGRTQRAHAPALWEQLMSLGQALDLLPAGLGARDTLRTEAGYSLYGHELTSDTTPIEAALGWAVALDKPRLQRPGNARGAKTGRCLPPLHCIQNDRQKRATASSQYKIFSADGNRPRDRRSDQRNTKPFAGLRHRPGLCRERPRQVRHRHRD